MKSQTTQQVIKAGSLDQSVRVLEQTRDELLHALGDRTIEPTPEVMLELMELNTALGDAVYYPGVQK